MGLGVYTDYSGLQGVTESGGYGTMPEDIYIRKIETTDLYEDPDAVNNYQRDLMKDFRPDAPFLASDQPRSANDRGGGTHSDRFLNLRFGGAPGDTSDPYLPDGTFLDHEFTERDPRGTTNEPNMRNHIEQQYARASFINFGNDSDNSVPSQGISPQDMISNKNALFYQFKDRFKNFDESLGGWHNGGSSFANKDIVGAKSNVLLDGTIINLADSSVRNRSDATTLLSADKRLSYRKYNTTDHRFKTAKYGFIKVRQAIQENDWSKSRRKVEVDRRQVDINGVMVNKALANLIIDIQGINDTKRAVAKGAVYGDSYKNQIAQRIHPSDLKKLAQIGIVSHSASANQIIDGMGVNGKMSGLGDNRKLQNDVKVSQHVLNSMEQGTKKKGKAVKDIRGVIEESAASNEFYHTNGNRQRAVKAGDIRGKVKQNHYIDDAKVAKSYSGIVPSKTNRVIDKVDKTGTGKTSWDNRLHVAKLRGLTSNKTTNNTHEQRFGEFEFGTFDKAKKETTSGKMGRTTQKHMEMSDGFGDEYTTSR